MPTIVHVITGTKGGIGKTMAAVSAVWSRKGYGISAIDSNWHNPDFGKILSRGQNPVGTAVLPSPGLLTWRPVNRMTLTRLKEAYVIPGGGAFSIWRLISLCTTSTTDYVVVDTGLHPLNLLTLTNTARQRALRDIALVPTDHLTIYIWFLWTYSAAYDEREGYRIGNSNDRLDRQILTWNQDWQSMKGNGPGDPLIVPIHVVNPHAMYNYRDLIDFIIQKRTVVPGLRDIKRMEPNDVYMTFMQFSVYMRAAFSTNILPENRFKVLYQNLVTKNSNRRPKNVFAIQQFCEDAVDFPAYLLKAPPSDIDEMIQGYEPFAQDIKGYLDQLEGL